MRRLLIALVVTALTACSQGGPQSGPKSPAPGIAATPARQDAKIGELVSKDGVTLTVTKVEPTDEGGQSANGHWLVVWLTVANDTEQPIYISSFSLLVRDDLGNSYHAYFCCFKTVTIAGPVLAHEKVTGPIYFDAPTGHLRLLWTSKPVNIDLGSPA